MIHKKFIDLNEFAKEKYQEYIHAIPFPHIVIDNLFDASFISDVSKEFPKSEIDKEVKKRNNFQVKKFSIQNELKFGPNTLSLFNYLNSQTWLRFLNKITSIEEKLFSDPYHIGGGLHGTIKGGWLKIHSDFKKHPDSNLDRRLNVIVFLNETWDESYGGYLEFWDRNLKTCIKKIPPIINKTVIFSTSDYSNHGHPDPLTCPENMTRKSMAFYYYTNGRPLEEIDYKLRQDGIKTYWKPRKKFLIDKQDFNLKFSLYHFFIEILRKILPQTFFRLMFRKNKS